MKCLTDEQIAIFIDGMEKDEEYKKIKLHLSECDKCLIKLNEVFELLDSVKEENSRIKKPIITFQKGTRNFRYRYVISAAMAASLVLVSLAVLKYTRIMIINTGKKTAINAEKNGNNTKSTGIHGKSIIALELMPDNKAVILQDAAKVSAGGISLNTMNSLMSSRLSQKKFRTIDERLAFERKILLIRCGYYYYMLKQTRNNSLFATVKEVMEQAFPDIRLMNLKKTSFESYEESIAGQNMADRGDFLKGFYLSYYIYMTDKTATGMEPMKHVIESLKDEEALGIDNLFKLKGAELDKLKTDIRNFFII